MGTITPGFGRMKRTLLLFALLFSLSRLLTYALVVRFDSFYLATLCCSLSYLALVMHRSPYATMRESPRGRSKISSWNQRRARRRQRCKSSILRLVTLVIVLIICSSLVSYSEAAEARRLRNLFRRSRLKKQSPNSMSAADLAAMHSITKREAGDMLTSVLFDVIRKNAILLLQTCAAALFAAQILALFGFIGERGEGLYHWAMKNKAMRQNVIENTQEVSWKVSRMVRKRIASMLQDFMTLAPRAKFASAVSLGVMAFPLFVKTSVITAKIVMGAYVVAEAFALMGLIGKPGEFISAWVKDGEHEEFLAKAKRIADEQRLLLRKRLRLHELVHNVRQWLGDDKIFWSGFGIGVVASLCLEDDEFVRI